MSGNRTPTPRPPAPPPPPPPPMTDVYVAPPTVDLVVPIPDAAGEAS